MDVKIVNQICGKRIVAVKYNSSGGEMSSIKLKLEDGTIFTAKLDCQFEDHCLNIMVENPDDGWIKPDE